MFPGIRAASIVASVAFGCGGSAPTPPATPAQPVEQPVPEPVAADGQPEPAPPTAPADTTPAKPSEPAVASKPPPPLPAPMTVPATLEDAVSSLHDILADAAFEKFSILAEGKTIRYRLTINRKRGKWKRLDTANDDLLFDFFSLDDEEGAGYAIAAIAGDISEKHFKINAKAAIVGYEDPGSYYSADFKFKKTGGKFVLIAIEASEYPPN